MIDCNLKQILNHLIYEELLHKHHTSFCGVYGRHIKLYFPDEKNKHGGLFVKCSQDFGIENEYRILNIAADHFNGYVVQPLQFWYEGNVNVAVYPLQSFKNIRPEKFDEKEIKNQLVDLFDRFISQDQSFQEELNVSDEALIIFYKQSGFSFFISLKDYFSYTMQNLRNQYGKISQHGDFAINNIAIDSKGNLILFDWENFGIINYPIFDLATLLFSNALDQGMVESFSKNPGILFDIPGASLIRLVCQKQGMSTNSFQKYFPFFMMLFIYLKQELGYGEYIVAWLKKFLDQVSTSEEWIALLRP